MELLPYFLILLIYRSLNKAVRPAWPIKIMTFATPEKLKVNGHLSALNNARGETILEALLTVSEGE